jgi:hypothetical protein
MCIFNYYMSMYVYICIYVYIDMYIYLHIYVPFDERRVIASGSEAVAVEEAVIIGQHREVFGQHTQLDGRFRSA